MNSSMYGHVCPSHLSLSLEKYGLFKSPTERQVASQFQEQTYYGIFLSRNCVLKFRGFVLFKMSVRVNVLSLFLFYVSYFVTSISARCRRGGYVAFYFLLLWNLLFRCYRFGVVFFDVFHTASKYAEGEFFDQCLVVCQLKFTALLRRF